MRIVRRILEITFLVILAVGIPYLGYLLYRSLEHPAKDPVQAIPDRTALIIHVNNPLELLGELTRNSLIWKEFLSYPGIRPIQEQLLLIDSMSRWSPEIREILKNSPLTITLSLHSRATFDPLFLMPVPLSVDGSSFASFIEKHYPGKITILQSPYARTQIYRIHFENQRNILIASVLEGVCIFSFSDALVKRAIDQLSLNTPVSVMKGFSTVASTTGKKVDANLYVNFPYLSLALWKGVNDSYNKGLVTFARYADWSGLDLYLKKDELLFNGYTIASDSAMQTLALLSDQTPYPITMTHILPGNTEAYLIYSLKQYPDYFERWQVRLKRANFSVSDMDLFSEMNSTYDTVLRSFLEPWSGHQAGRCWIPLPAAKRKLSPVTILQATNADSALRSLLSLSRIIGKKLDSTMYEGIPVYRTGLSDVINLWLNPLFKPSDLTFFTVIGDFICFSDNHEVLKQLIRCNLTNDCLPENNIYREISDHISDQANLSFYCHSDYLLDALPEVLSPDYQPLFTHLLDSLKKFQTFSLQISAADGMFYTSIQLRFNPQNRSEGPLEWQTLLDTLVSGSPQIVRAGTGDTFAVLVTDTMNTLYKIDRKGAILWKQKLYGRVLGSFHEVMLTGSDTLFYLFNTENHLYLIRSDGKHAPRFPMKFPVRSSNGLALLAPRTLPSPALSLPGKQDPGLHPVSSGNPGEFQVVIAFRNNRIYSFNLDGVLTEGWCSPEVEEEVTQPVQVLGGGNTLVRRPLSAKDRGNAQTLIVTMKSGKVLVTDRFGVQKLKPEKGFSHSPGSLFYENRTNLKGPWLTTDIEGNVVYLKENGQVSRVRFHPFSSTHFFLYEDLLKDGTPEFIFFDDNTLYFYNRFLKLLYFYTFRHEVSPPGLKRLPDGKILIGFTSQVTNEVFLFDRNGYVKLPSGIRGTTPFDLGSLESRDRTDLVIGAGNVLKVFRLADY
ncbi:MAG: hypothetical protein JXA23_07780 [Bacteroidales bacterium]|nr:hypothetical protein [Bacteroidales bacterium]